MAFLGAGILFADEKHVLAGYSYKKQITGFGGHCIGRETPAQTAFREVVEELFEVEVGEELVDKLISEFRLKEFYLNDNYWVAKCSFEELERLLMIVKQSGIVSLLYDEMPIKIEDLVFRRKLFNVEHVEHTHIVLLPYSSEIAFEPLFLSDIKLFQTNIPA
jgi:hypothetical protein